MKFSYSIFESFVKDIKSKVVGNRIGNITTINSRDFLISFTTNREEKLLVSLNHQNPFLSYIEVNDSIPTIPGNTNDILRKELKDALIKDVKILNNDRLFVMNLCKTNDLFEREEKSLIFEFIPQRSNLILLDKENKVIFALNYSPLETVRPLLKGITYIHPQKKETFVLEETPLTGKEFKLFAQDYLNESIRKRLLERYDLLFKHIKSRTKSQKAKIKVLEQEIENAKHNLRYQEIGNMILSLVDDVEQLDAYLKEQNVSLNQDYTLGQNANLFFKKYKKARRTIEMDSLELEKANKEIMRYDSISAAVKYMNDDDLLGLAMELMPNKFSNPKNKMPKNKISYVTIDNAKIYFGKNTKQNDEITFKISKPSYTYLHIKDYHGAHVVIATDNPTKEQLLIAAEFCLILSNKTVGDVMYTSIKNVRKGSTLGEALLKTYELITLTSIRKETYQKLNNWKAN